MYDPVVKVPLIVKLPGQVRAGEVSDELVNNVDVAPTLLRAAGCEVPQAMQGRDLAGDGPARTAVFAEDWAGVGVYGAHGRPQAAVVPEPRAIAVL